MLRRIITIDEDKCNGCGICAEACHEAAIHMVDGKAKLLRDDYCDGLGDCLPACPTNAISFEEREAAAYDEVAVKANMTKVGKVPPAGGCPGSNAHVINHDASVAEPIVSIQENVVKNQLNQWPVQIKLVPTTASYFENAHLLIAADCGAYAYANFHNEFMRNKITLIGCPKLDECDYSEKLGDIIKQNNLKSVTVVRMEVPCCGGLEQATIQALQQSGKMIPWQVVTLSTDGHILEN